MQKTQVVMAFLLGAVVALSAALVVTAGRTSLPAAYGQGVSANNEMLMTATTDTPNQNNTIFVMDTKGMRLGVYKFTGAHLSLAAIRQITYDMKVQDMPVAKGELSVSDVQKAAQEADANAKGGPNKGH